jgi:hypothetical protein
LSAYLETFERLTDRIRAALCRPSLTLPVLVIFAITATLPASPADPDLFARVALGRLAQTTGTVPTIDPFAFSPKLPMWIDHEWLSGVVFWNIVSFWGDAGLIALKVALICLTTTFIVGAAKIASPGIQPNLFFLALCLVQGIYSWGSTIRCQTFTYLFLAYQLFALVAHRQRNTHRYLIPFPMIAIAWVNLHGGYALGMTFLWLWTILSFLEERRSWFLVAVSALASTAPLFTPYGFLTFSRCLVDAITMKRPTISEWAPLWHHPLLFGGLAVVIVILVAGIALTRDIRRHILPLGVLAYAIYCGISHLRFVTATVMVCAIFGGAYFEAFLRTARQRLPLRMERLERVVAVAALGAISLCLATIVRASTKPATYHLDYSAYPVAATQWLRERKIEGKLLVDFNTGSFALWRLYPRMTVSMDGRYEAVYAPETDQLNTEALQLGTPRSERAINLLQPTHALIHLSSPAEELAPSILSSWNVIYRDDLYAVLSRADIGTNLMDHEALGTTDMWQPLF